MSRRRDRQGLILLGGIILIGLMKKTRGIAWGHGWHWPVPDLVTRDGKKYLATISQEFKPATHLGVDIMYRRTSITDRPEFPAAPGANGVRNGSPMYFAPPETPILAARDGRVWSVSKGARGWSVVLDHGKPWATFYTHLERVDLEPHKAGKAIASGQPTNVKAGDMLGTMGGDPLESTHLRHLHFAAWYEGQGDDASVDPAGVIQTWGRSSWQI